MSGTRTTVLVFADGARLTLIGAAGLRGGLGVGSLDRAGRVMVAVVDRDAIAAGPAREALSEILAVGQRDRQAVC